MERRTFLRGALPTLALGILASCAYGPVLEPAGGPPPWAPAHGYRRNHASGVTLVYDTGLGAYVVAGMPGYYYIDDRFYRSVTGAWQISVQLDGPWQSVGGRGLPPGLAKKGGYAVPPGHRRP